LIPAANITAWRRHAPWPDDTQVEQDLILSRFIVEIGDLPGTYEPASAADIVMTRLGSRLRNAPPRQEIEAAGWRT
jgi:hypothetical protein